MGTLSHYLTFKQYQADLIMRRSFVPLPKSSRPERILSNSQVFDFELSEDDMVAIDALDKGKAGAVTWNPVDAD